MAAGCDHAVVLTRGSVKTDWEVELGVVIGARARCVTEAQALAHMADYCVINDISQRQSQIERGGAWDKGKGCDTFGPVGPWMVTADEVGDPQSLALWLDVYGRRCQDGNIRTMVFGVAELVSCVGRSTSGTRRLSMAEAAGRPIKAVLRKCCTASLRRCPTRA